MAVRNKESIERDKFFDEVAPKKSFYLSANRFKKYNTHPDFISTVKGLMGDPEKECVVWGYIGLDKFNNRNVQVIIRDKEQYELAKKLWASGQKNTDFNPDFKMDENDLDFIP